MWKVIIGESILVIAGIISLILWHKKIDSETTWMYGIYIAIQLILWLFVLIGVQQYWSTHC